MKEKIRSAIKKIVYIPHNHYNGDKSELTLLDESGYFELYNKINEEEIMAILRLHPHLITEWLGLSEDSRSSNRWNFWKSEDGKYHVGHWPESEQFESINSTDEFYGCAAYIKRHIESIRILFKR